MKKFEKKIFHRLPTPFELLLPPMTFSRSLRIQRLLNSDSLQKARRIRLPKRTRRRSWPRLNCWESAKLPKRIWGRKLDMKAFCIGNSFFFKNLSDLFSEKSGKSPNGPVFSPISSSMVAGEPIRRAERARTHLVVFVHGLEGLLIFFNKIFINFLKSVLEKFFLIFFYMLVFKKIKI